MADPLRVGIIGARAGAGWARESHVPAVQTLGGLTLAAVATSHQTSAEEAAQAFGAPKAYPSGLALIADPDIDIVTVATRVPDHRDLVLAAAAAGKSIYSEWPLGRGSDESRAMAEAARTAGVHDVIGLQLRASPAVATARDLIGSGALGRLLGLSAFSPTAGFGPDVPSAFAYLEEPGHFANLVTIQGAHTLDLLIALAGGLAHLSTLASRQFPAIHVGDERTPRRRETFDHLLVQGQFAPGTPFTVEVAGGRPPETLFHCDIVGEKGRLRLHGSAARGLQSGRLGLLRDGVPVPVDEGELAGLPDAAVNVAGLYAGLRDDIVAGTRRMAGFSHAAQLSRLIEDALDSSRRGQRLDAHDWPVR